jgi:hypothetical protein
MVRSLYDVVGSNCLFNSILLAASQYIKSNTNPKINEIRDQQGLRKLIQEYYISHPQASRTYIKEVLRDASTGSDFECLSELGNILKELKAESKFEITDKLIDMYIELLSPTDDKVPVCGGRSELIILSELLKINIKFQNFSSAIDFTEESDLPLIELVIVSPNHYKVYVDTDMIDNSFIILPQPVISHIDLSASSCSIKPPLFLPSIKHVGSDIEEFGKSPSLVPYHPAGLSNLGSIDFLHLDVTLKRERLVEHTVSSVPEFLDFSLRPSKILRSTSILSSQQGSEAGYVETPLDILSQTPSYEVASSQERQELIDSYSKSNTFKEFLHRTNEKDLTLYFMKFVLKKLFEQIPDDMILSFVETTIMDVGCGEGTVLSKMAKAIRGNLQKRIEGVKFNLCGIDQDERFVEQTKTKIKECSFADNGIIQGDCFGADLDKLPNAPHVIIVSHIAYYSNGIDSFVDSLMRKAGLNTIIIFAHQSELSGINGMREVLGSNVNTKAASLIRLRLDAFKDSFTHVQLLLGSFVKLPILLDKIEMISSLTTSDKDKNTKRILEFLAQQKISEVIGTGLDDAFFDMLFEISINKDLILFWDQVEILVPKASVFAPHLESIVRKQELFSDFTGFSPIHLASLQGSSSITTELISMCGERIIESLALGYITPFYMAKLGWHFNPKPSAIDTITLLLSRLEPKSIEVLRAQYIETLNWINEVAEERDNGAFVHPIEVKNVGNKFSQKSLEEKYELITQRFPFLLRDILLDFYFKTRLKDADALSDKKAILNVATYLAKEFLFFKESHLLEDSKISFDIYIKIGKIHELLDRDDIASVYYENALDFAMTHKLEDVPQMELYLWLAKYKRKMADLDASKSYLKSASAHLLKLGAQESLPDGEFKDLYLKWQKDIELINISLTEEAIDSMYSAHESNEEDTSVDLTVGYTYIEYNNQILNSPYLLRGAFAYGGNKLVNLLIDLGVETEYASQMLNTVEQESPEYLFRALLHPKQEKLPDINTPSLQASVPISESFNYKSLIAPTGASVMKLVESKESLIYIFTRIIPLFDEENILLRNLSNSYEGYFVALHLAGGVAFSFAVELEEDMGVFNKLILPVIASSTYSLQKYYSLEFKSQLADDKHLISQLTSLLTDFCFYSILNIPVSYFQSDYSFITNGLWQTSAHFVVDKMNNHVPSWQSNIAANIVLYLWFSSQVKTLINTEVNDAKQVLSSIYFLSGLLPKIVVLHQCLGVLIDKFCDYTENLLSGLGSIFLDEE